MTEWEAGRRRLRCGEWAGAEWYTVLTFVRDELDGKKRERRFFFMCTNKIIGFVIRGGGVTFCALGCVWF